MLLCTDFDGTLKDPNNSDVLVANLHALTLWREAGNHACLVTGRNFSVMPNILPEWRQYFDYLITDNGGATFDRQDNLITQYRFSPGYIDEILKIIPKNVLPVYYFTSDYTTDRERYPTKTPIKLRLWFHTLKQLWTVFDSLESSELKIKSLPWPKPGFSPLKGVDLSQYCGFIDVVPQISGKESAIQRLVDKCYPKENIYDIEDHRRIHDNSAEYGIITVGDDYNDIGMLQSFEGYAINTAPPEVIQAVSGRTVCSVSELISLKMGSS